ncbi:MAG: Tol-Pal system protein TolB [Alphaproteobacteria bacterium]|nr:Tol-Pal system protein TolB [Alphaproteobacteria bacterium]
MKKIILLILFALYAFSVRAELKIDITGARSEPIPVAISEFTGVSKADEIRKIIINNLEGSGLFRVIDKNAYIQKLQNIEENPVFSEWQAINAQALLFANVDEVTDNRLKISFKLWDVYAKQTPILAKALTLSKNDWRRLGHIVSDMVYSEVTGEDGYFDSRLVYVAQSGIKNRPIKRLAIMDQDGENHHFLTDGSNLVLTPRFAPDMQKIAYMSYQGGKPRIFIMDLFTREEMDLGVFEGMSFAPRFSNDGKKLALSLSKKGNSDVYLYDLENKKYERLTKHLSIDTSPSFSPDGTQIVFNSDRSGSQQLYIMTADGKNVKRISFGSKGSYATPVWSPRGDYIAFTKIQSGTFYIGVMRPDGSGERLITQGFLVEGPSFSPNGRVLTFFKQQPYDGSENEGKSGIYTIDITGYNERFLKTPTEASDPAWSSLLFKNK